MYNYMHTRVSELATCLHILANNSVLRIT